MTSVSIAGADKEVRMLLLTPAVLTFLWCAEPTLPGRVDAMNDLRAGNLALESAGYPLPEATDYWALLRERYGIEMHGVAGCCVTTEQIDHIRGYNAVMTAAIERRYGKGTLDRAMNEATKIYHARFATPRTPKKKKK